VLSIQHFWLDEARRVIAPRLRERKRFVVHEDLRIVAQVLRRRLRHCGHIGDVSHRVILALVRNSFLTVVCRGRIWEVDNDGLQLIGRGEGGPVAMSELKYDEEHRYIPTERGIVINRHRQKSEACGLDSSGSGNYQLGASASVLSCRSHRGDRRRYAAPDHAHCGTYFDALSNHLARQTSYRSLDGSIGGAYYVANGAC
jgi:hypothetical protein